MNASEPAAHTAHRLWLTTAPAEQVREWFMGMLEETRLYPSRHPDERWTDYAAGVLSGVGTAPVREAFLDLAKTLLSKGGSDLALSNLGEMLVTNPISELSDALNASLFDGNNLSFAARALAAHPAPPDREQPLRALLRAARIGGCGSGSQWEAVVKSDDPLELAPIGFLGMIQATGTLPPLWALGRLVEADWTGVPGFELAWMWTILSRRFSAMLDPTLLHKAIGEATCSRPDLPARVADRILRELLSTSSSARSWTVVREKGLAGFIANVPHLMRQRTFGLGARP